VTVHTISTPMPGRPPQVNAYLARVDGGWLLVDGGLATDEAWHALDGAVRAIAGGWREVTVRVATHMHMDHVGLAARAGEASGAPLWMGALDAERMRHAAAEPDDEAAYRATLLLRSGAPPELRAEVEALRRRAEPLAPPVFADGRLEGAEGPVPGAAGWRFVWTPGHTAGHVSLFRPRDGALIAGDAVLARITPTLGVNRQRTDPVGDYIDALARLDRLAPTTVLPGHCDPPADGIARIRELRDAADAETRTIEGLIEGGDRSCWEVVEARYPGRSMPIATRMLALRETMAHLERLAAAGRASAATDTGGVVRYSTS
jgi:glyoxylase-like metal-dependent hydrolase (beta-lactamase superfamily II)